MAKDGSTDHDDRVGALLAALKGRTVKGCVVEGDSEKLHIGFTDGVVLSLWVDEESFLCIDLDRVATH